jgi:hypothetical protein
VIKVFRLKSKKHGKIKDPVLKFGEMMRQGKKSPDKESIRTGVADKLSEICYDSDFAYHEE